WYRSLQLSWEISPEKRKNLPKEAEAAINPGKRSASESGAAEDAFNTMMELPDHRRTKRRIIENFPKKARAIDLQAEAGKSQIRTGREEPPPDARDPSLSSVDDTGRLFPRSSEEERSKRENVPAESNKTALNSSDLLGNGRKALHPKSL
ncbi:hypothetical protein V3C99_010920, partial [Haemonchus contortus]